MLTTEGQHLQNGLTKKMKNENSETKKRSCYERLKAIGQVELVTLTSTLYSSYGPIDTQMGLTRWGASKHQFMHILFW